MHSSAVPAMVIAAIGCLTAFNVLSSLFLVRNTLTSPKVESREFTYVGDDYPEHWPLPAVDPVALVVEESTHYPILGPDARDDWASTNPEGFGYLRLGPEHRAFALSMFHEHHCLRLMRSGLAGDYRPTVVEHFGHCLNYLRQAALCFPDLTLEPYDALDRDFEVERVGSTHVCNDWRQVYDAMPENWAAWVKVRPSVQT